MNSLDYKPKAARRRKDNARRRLNHCVRSPTVREGLIGYGAIPNGPASDTILLLANRQQRIRRWF